MDSRSSVGDGLSASLMVVSFPEGDFFFDYVRQMTDWHKKEKPMKGGMAVSVAYKVMFMRKLWINVVPGRDLKADVIFHFPQ
eukprot:g21806.t1